MAGADGKHAGLAGPGQAPGGRTDGGPAVSGLAEVHRGGTLVAVVPIRTNGGLNAREHWRARSARVSKEREATGWCLAGKERPILPVTVTMTRTGPSNGLDDDNLAGSCKAVRDAVAKWLGVDDRDPRVFWRYAQRRAKDWAVEVTVA